METKPATCRACPAVLTAADLASGQAFPACVSCLAKESTKAAHRKHQAAQKARFSASAKKPAARRPSARVAQLRAEEREQRRLDGGGHPWAMDEE